MIKLGNDENLNIPRKITIENSFIFNLIKSLIMSSLERLEDLQHASDKLSY